MIDIHHHKQIHLSISTTIISTIVTTKCPSSFSNHHVEVSWIIHFNRISPYKPTILGIPHLWKPPYISYYRFYSSIYMSYIFLYFHRYPNDIPIYAIDQWEFQDPKLEVPTIYKAYSLGLNFREYPHKIWPNIWYVYVPPF